MRSGNCLSFNNVSECGSLCFSSIVFARTRRERWGRVHVDTSRSWNVKALAPRRRGEALIQCVKDSATSLRAGPQQRGTQLQRVRCAQVMHAE